MGTLIILILQNMKMIPVTFHVTLMAHSSGRFGKQQWLLFFSYLILQSNQVTYFFLGPLLRLYGFSFYFSFPFLLTGALYEQMLIDGNKVLERLSTDNIFSTFDCGDCTTVM
jgi:hypothetical protein